MTRPSIEFHKIWIDQCSATEGICEHFGLVNALDYLIGEKLFNFVSASETDEQFAAELPAFIAAIRKLFNVNEIAAYLDYLEQTKFLTSPEIEYDTDDTTDDEDLWIDNPIAGAEELLRFCRIRHLLQE